MFFQEVSEDTKEVPQKEEPTTEEKPKTDPYWESEGQYLVNLA